MGRERGHFTDEFKTEAIALLAGSGRRVVEIAGELGISPWMLGNWRNRQGGQPAGSGVPAQPASAMSCVADRAAEISRLCHSAYRPRAITVGDHGWRARARSPIANCRAISGG